MKTGGPELSTLYITTRAPDGGGMYSVQLPHNVRGLDEPEFADQRAVGHCDGESLAAVVRTSKSTAISSSGASTAAAGWHPATLFGRSVSSGADVVDALLSSAAGTSCSASCQWCVLLILHTFVGN
jgi:hypothetical protein